jgi:hypothetical protein
VGKALLPHFRQTVQPTVEETNRHHSPERAKYTNRRLSLTAALQADSANQVLHLFYCSEFPGCCKMNTLIHRILQGSIIRIILINIFGFQLTDSVKLS